MKTPATAKTIEERKDQLHAVGRRKTAKCTVNFIKGEGESTVNGKKFDEYFKKDDQRAIIMLPFVVTKKMGDFYFRAKVSGGGIMGQASALRTGIARCLALIDDVTHSELAKENLLTRDPRAKERKKIYFVRARKKPQFSKR